MRVSRMAGLAVLGCALMSLAWAGSAAAAER